MQHSTIKMHKYILGWLGLMAVFGVTVPIAMARVSASAKFANQPFNSQTCDSKQPANRTVTSWIETCSRMSVAPIATKVDPPKVESVVQPAAIAPPPLPSPVASPTTPIPAISSSPGPEANPAMPEPASSSSPGPEASPVTPAPVN